MNELKQADPAAQVNTRPHQIIALMVLVFSLVLYFMTIAPTTSFWDCGEFIACSYSMGVPHPPGAPFYLLLGRIFSLIVPSPDIGWRVNALSALLSAVTVLLTYLVTVRLVRRWRGPEHSTLDKWVLYGSGVVAAGAFATSHSFWFNAVEAEVYAISMFFTALVFWLAVRWQDHHDTPLATKYLLLIAYFVGLAIGIHLLNVLALSPIIVLLYFQKYRFTWKGLTIAMAISFAAILVVYPGIVAGVPKLIGANILWKVLVLAALIGSTVWAIRARRHLMSIVFSSVLLVLLGYSTYIVIYVRSNLDPVINENQPDTVERLISYLNREQYGAVGPVAIENYSAGTIRRLQENGAAIMPLGGGNVLRFHILERKAPFFSYQINQMYIRYLSWQYFATEHGKPLVFPFLFGLLGMVWHWWRDPKRAYGVSLLFLLTGLAIVFYLNQEDPQPRERDYAYVGSFWAFAIWIGMGVAALFEFLEDAAGKTLQNKFRFQFAVISVIAVGVLVPVRMLAVNFDSHDRSGNYVAWDYSRNMLETADPNAIIFTNGDNDTFPLWYLQVVEGIRTDVRVVNLSLLNTNWYIKQLRDDEPKVPISLNDRQIDERLTGITDEALLARYWPPEQRAWRVRKPDGGVMEWEVPATMHIPTGMPNEQPGAPNFLRVQDVMILHIVEQNQWRKPIYFAVTVSNTNLVGLERHLAMEGLLFKLHPDLAPDIDEPELRDNLFNVYRDHYRNLDNPDVHYFDNVLKLLQNYRSGFLQLVYAYYRQIEPGQLNSPSGVPEEMWDSRFEDLTPAEKALHTLRTMDDEITLDAVPQTNRDVALQIGRLYMELGDSLRGAQYFNHVIDFHGGDLNTRLQAAYYIAQYGGDRDRMRELIDEALDEDRSTGTLFAVAAIYERLRIDDELREILTELRGRPDLTVTDRLDLGTFYFTLEDYGEVVAIYEQLAAENPGNGEVLGGLMGAYQEMGDSVQVRRTLERWLERNPADAEARRLYETWGGNPDDIVTLPEGTTPSLQRDH